MDLKERLAYLESVNRFRIEALDMIRDLSGFQVSMNQLEDPGIIFDTCRSQVEKLLQVRTLAFFLIDEDSADFNLQYCRPESARQSLETEMAQFIEDATFSRAVLEKKPVTASSEDFNTHYLFHVLATVSRVRGMCVAILDGNPREVPEAGFELLSILMTHCANALESYDLYHRLKLSNQILEEKDLALSRSEASLTREVGAHKNTLAALKKSESQYRLLAETARDMIMTITREGRVTYLNPAGQDLGGFQTDTLENGFHCFKGLERLLARKQESFSNCHRITLSPDSDRDIPLEVSLARIIDEKAEETFLVVGRDISAQLRAEKERAGLEERLWQARKMESIGLLAGGTAHDFNNLLSIICNYTELAMATLAPEDKAYLYLGRVEDASQDAVALARQLYTIGREDRHETHQVDLGSLLFGTLKLLGSSLGKKVALVSEIREEGLMVMAEETRLRQVLMNLITNAAHVMESGTIEAGADRVEILPGSKAGGLGVDPGRFIRFWVKDTGPGIAPDVLPHIFEPYFSTKAGSTNAGLGLAVVHGIIKNYDGAIEVESISGKGTCFYIYLPEAVS